MRSCPGFNSESVRWRPVYCIAVDRVPCIESKDRYIKRLLVEFACRSSSPPLEKIQRDAKHGRECGRSKGQVKLKLEKLVKTEEDWIVQGLSIAQVVIGDSFAGESQVR